MTERCVQNDPLMQPENSEANRMIHVGVMRTSCFTSWWRYTYDAVMTDTCVQNRPLMKHVNSGTNRIMYDGVMRTSCFMAKHQNLTRRHRKGLWRNNFLLITFDHKGLLIETAQVWSRSDGNCRRSSFKCETWKW